MKILCLTDIHGNKKNIPVVLKRENDSDLIIIAGDITQLGGYKEAEQILSPLLESNIRIIAVHGNMDRNGVIEFLKENNISVHDHILSEGDFVFFGLGGSNPTPLNNTPQEYSDPDAKLFMNNILSGINQSKRKIFVSHAPPKNTCLDRVSGNVHVGSQLVREIIEKYGIDLCVCGHIHESAGTDRIGKSFCVNPGAFREGHYAVIDITVERINIVRRKV